MVSGLGPPTTVKSPDYGRGTRSSDYGHTDLQVTRIPDYGHGTRFDPRITTQAYPAKPFLRLKPLDRLGGKWYNKISTEGLK